MPLASPVTQVLNPRLTTPISTGVETKEFVLNIKNLTHSLYYKMVDEFDNEVTCTLINVPIYNDPLENIKLTIVDSVVSYSHSQTSSNINESGKQV